MGQNTAQIQRVEGTIPHPNQGTVELAPFSVPTRLLTRPGTAREDLLAAVPGLLGERGEFRVTELLRALNPRRDRTRYLALRQALRFMVEGGRGREPEFERVRRGVYRLVRTVTADGRGPVHSSDADELSNIVDSLGVASPTASSTSGCRSAGEGRAS